MSDKEELAHLDELLKELENASDNVPGAEFDQFLTGMQKKVDKAFDNAKKEIYKWQAAATQAKKCLAQQNNIRAKLKRLAGTMKRAEKKLPQVEERKDASANKKSKKPRKQRPASRE